VPAHTPAPAPAQAVPGASADLEVRVRLTDAQGTRVVSMPLDDYVLGCVRAELPPLSKDKDPRVLERILELQAIVSRTYAVANLHRHEAEGFDLCDSTHCQLYRGPTRTEHAGDPSALAVRTTEGQVVTYGGRAIQAVFHSNCGGHTAAAEQVWNGPPVPYLRPVPDWFCSRTSNAPWTFVTTEADLRRALNADQRTAIGTRLDRVDIDQRDAAGRAVTITLAGAKSSTVRAEDFRATMRRAFGPRSIQSTWFTITRQANEFRFSGVGYGHGVGMCQAGAALRAQAGQSPAAIVAHYFPGTQITAARQAARP
jgi:stage II sporulation protein D